LGATHLIIMAHIGVAPYIYSILLIQMFKIKVYPVDF